MKIERRVDPGVLWAWLQSHLPDSLKGHAMPSGYGFRQYIYAGGTMPSFLSRHCFEQIGDPVAEVSGTLVELYHPQYYSDFQNLLQSFEAETKVEPKLVYWEGKGHD